MLTQTTGGLIHNASWGAVLLTIQLEELLDCSLLLLSSGSLIGTDLMFCRRGNNSAWLWPRLHLAGLEFESCQ